MSARGIEFEFKKVGDLDGRYLVRGLNVSFTLLGKEYAGRELFALDTGSPMAVLRWNAFSFPVGAVMEDPEVKCAEVTGWVGATMVHSILNVRLSSGSFAIVLPTAKISQHLDGHGFSLLGTDLLEKLDMRFSARKGSAVLTLRDISDAEKPCVLGKVWARRLVPGQPGRKEEADV